MRCHKRQASSRPLRNYCFIDCPGEGGTRSHSNAMRIRATGNSCRGPECKCDAEQKQSDPFRASGYVTSWMSACRLGVDRRGQGQSAGRWESQMPLSHLQRARPGMKSHPTLIPFLLPTTTTVALLLRLRSVISSCSLLLRYQQRLPSSCVRGEYNK